MNTNKLIFSLLGILIFIGVIFLALNLRAWGNKTINTGNTDLKIWILSDEKEKFIEYLNTFKSSNPSYANRNFIVESFEDETVYYNTLVASIFSWEGPDVFVINNSETSVLENQILWIPPTIISPNDFRLRFKPVFWVDLIIKDETDETVEFLKGVPAWYEALWIFYNRKYFLRPSEMKTWTNFSKEIKNIWEKYSKIIPIGLWNGSGVSRVADIMQAFFVLEWVETLGETNVTETRQVMAMYSAFGQNDGDNWYSGISGSFTDETDIDFFTQGDIAAMVWYPRDLVAINDIGYQKSFLFATPFPWYAGEEKKAAINYNSFVINKNTELPNTALALLQYMSSVWWQQAFVDTFPYYLSPTVSVELAMLEKKILPEYNIVYKNFMDESTQLVSYNSWNKISFDREIKNIADMKFGHDEAFSDLRSFLICSTTKQQTLLNLSSPCR